MYTIYKYALYPLIFVLLGTFNPIKAQTKTRILFVLDGSQSMLGLWENEQKMKVANRLLGQLMDSLKTIPNLEVALRVYGHQHSVAAGNRSCLDSKLEVPFADKNFEKIKNTLRTIIPQGTTPIAYSLEKSADDFPTCNSCRNILILITDGIEECDGDPCAVSLALQRKGVVMKPFVIGMGLDVETIDAFKCIGHLQNTSSSASFSRVLNVVISQALNNTSMQVNLLDSYEKPTETDVAMTLYDNFSGEIRYNFIHTINHRGYPDTLPIDPSYTYDLVVHTIPPVSKDSIIITPGTHTTIGVDAPQGMLSFKMKGLNEYKDLKCVIRKKDSVRTMWVQNFEHTTEYITGDYDLEILTLPRTYINNINVRQSHTTTIEIQEPGVAHFFLPSTGISTILQKNQNKTELVHTLPSFSTNESVVLQPGSYSLIYRNKKNKDVEEVIVKDFVIKSGISTSVKW